MKRFVLLILLIALPAPLHAEFSAQEKAEIREIGDGIHAIAMGFKRAGEGYAARGSDANRLQYHAALAEHWGAYQDCGLAWGHLLNSPGISGYWPDRATRIQNAVNSIGACRAHIAAAVGRWSALGETAVAAQLQAADALLAGFDQSLPYTSWQPPSYPAVVGPHDDWFTSQRHLHRMFQYSLMQATGDAIGFLGHASSIPATCGGSFRQVMAQFQDAISHQLRGWALFSGIVFTSRWSAEMDDDAAFLQRLVDASQGLRPPEFFEPALGAQYLWSKGSDVPMISGDLMKTGVSPRLFAATSFFADFVECAGADDLPAAWVKGNKLASAAAQPGRAKEFFVDLNDGWNDHDMPGASLLNFFHAPPVSPPAGALALEP